MLEVITLLIITREIGMLAESKGLRPLRWKILCIALFLLLELVGILVSLFFVSMDNLITIGLIGYGFGISSYPIIKNYLSKKPDPTLEDDI